MIDFTFTEVNFNDRFCNDFGINPLLMNARQSIWLRGKMRKYSALKLFLLNVFKNMIK